MMELKQLVSQAKAAKNYRQLAQFAPYAKLIGMEFDEQADGRLLFRLPFQPDNIGNAMLPALHGGVIAAFMEHSATLEILWNMEAGALPKIIDFSIDYLRPGRPELLYAQCSVIRQGQRVANVAVNAWQDNPSKSIATARMHFLLSRQAAS